MDVAKKGTVRTQVLASAYKFHIFQLLQKHVFGIAEDEVGNHISMLERQVYFQGGVRIGSARRYLHAGNLDEIRRYDTKQLADHAPRLVLSRFSFGFGLISLAV